MSIRALASLDSRGGLCLSTVAECHGNAKRQQHVEIALEYLNEGGANLVLVVKPLGGQDAVAFAPQLRAKLLRLRKYSRNDLDTINQYRALHACFVPLFQTDQILQTALVSCSRPFLKAVQAALPTMPRPPRRADSGLAQDETHAMFITDMRSHQSTDCAVLQFKPKWLMQSPDAPPTARRCRTCALRAYRVSQGASTPTDDQEICPLSLLSTDVGDRAVASAVLTRNNILTKWLTHESHQLLSTLQYWQNSFDPDGVLRLNQHWSTQKADDLCKAMTLRDCTIYLRVTTGGDAVEARLGDLDLKHVDKVSKWTELEMMLISNGWYTNTEGVDSRTVENVCMLSRLKG